MKIVSVYSPKGGVGKSLFTEILSSHIHYTSDKNVMVIDADKPQYSIYTLREREIEALSDGLLREKIENHFESINKKAYRIITSEPTEILQKINQIGKTEQIDIAFVDLPGTVNIPGVLNTLINASHIFIPLEADNQVFNPTLTFACSLPERMREKIYFFWNRRDLREKGLVYDKYSEYIMSKGFKILKTHIPISVSLKHEISGEKKETIRSTLLPPNLTKVKSNVLNIKELLTEIETILK